MTKWADLTSVHTYLPQFCFKHYVCGPAGKRPSSAIILRYGRVNADSGLSSPVKSPHNACQSPIFSPISLSVLLQTSCLWKRPSSVIILCYNADSQLSSPVTPPHNPCQAPFCSHISPSVLVPKLCLWARLKAPEQCHQLPPQPCHCQLLIVITGDAPSQCLPVPHLFTHISLSFAPKILFVGPPASS